jgi:hypothetical protein
MKYPIRVAHRGITVTVTDGHVATQRLFLAVKDDPGLNLFLPGDSWYTISWTQPGNNDSIAPLTTIIQNKF